MSATRRKDTGRPGNGGRFDHAPGQRSSASLDPVHFFHATNQNFEPGDVLAGGHSGMRYPEDEAWRSTRVWMASDPGNAGTWWGHEDEEGVHVYEVKPEEPAPHRPTAFDEALDADHAYDQYHATTATVVRRLSLSEWNDLHRPPSTYPAPGANHFRWSHEEMLAEAADPQRAAGLCEYVNGAYLIHLRDDHGIEGELVDLKHKETGVAHTVALVDGRIVDWTARQFDPQASIPTTHNPDDFYRTWQFLQSRATDDLD